MQPSHTNLHAVAVCKVGLTLRQSLASFQTSLWHANPPPFFFFFFFDFGFFNSGLEYRQRMAVALDYLLEVVSSFRFLGVLTCRILLHIRASVYMFGDLPAILFSSDYILP